MKLKAIGILLALTTLFIGASVTSSHGLTSDTLVAAGWDCGNAGPHNWMHCTGPGVGPAGAPATIQVMVFGETGHPFLGSEILVRADIYNGQPCPQDNLDHYHPLDFDEPPDGITDYYACHHFDTGG